MRALVRQKALEGSDGAEGERNTAEGFRSMNQSRLPAAERGEPCALVSGGEGGVWDASVEIPRPRCNKIRP